MKSTSAAQVIIQALWPGPEPEIYDVPGGPASAPRAAWFTYASRSATRCASDGGLGDGEVRAGLGPVWARSGEQIATAAINKRIRISTKVLRGAARAKARISHSKF